jgi:hypothetical protein
VTGAEHRLGLVEQQVGEALHPADGAGQGGVEQALGDHLGVGGPASR